MGGLLLLQYQTLCKSLTTKLISINPYSKGGHLRQAYKPCVIGAMPSQTYRNVLRVATKFRGQNQPHLPPIVNSHHHTFPQVCNGIALFTQNFVSLVEMDLWPPSPLDSGKPGKLSGKPGRTRKPRVLRVFWPQICGFSGSSGFPGIDLRFFGFFGFSGHRSEVFRVFRVFQAQI